MSSDPDRWSLDRLAVVLLAAFAVLYAVVAGLVLQSYLAAREDDQPRNPHTGVLERE